MRKIIIMLSALLITTALVACSDSDAYDQEGFKQVKEYTEGILPKVDDAITYAELWLDEQTDENHEKMVKLANEINEVNSNLFIFGDNEKYDQEEVESWTIDLALEEGEWVIEGDELFRSLSDIEEDSSNLAQIILKLKKSADDVEVEELTLAVNKAKESKESLREMMTR